MTWTPAARHYLLGTTESFMERYCDSATCARMYPGHTPGLLQIDGQVQSLRRVIRRLTQLMPAAAHATPDWNDSPLPIVVIGKANGIGRLADKRRVGLCSQDEQLFVWVDGRVDAPPGLQLTIGDPPLWEMWRPSAAEGRPPLWRYTEPVDLFNDGGPPINHPLHEHHAICQLLSWIGTQALQVQNAPVVGYVAPYRLQEELPATASVIYPALLRRASPR